MAICLSKSYLFALICFVYYTKLCLGISKSITFIILGKERSCFFHFFPANISIDVNFEVVQGGDLAVTFEFIDPNGTRVVAKDERKTYGSHSVMTREAAGNYMFCFNNVHSRADKIVYYEFMTDGDLSDDSHQLYNELERDLLEGSSQYDMTIEECRVPLDRMKLTLDKGLQIMSLLKVLEARDRAQQENNFERVNFWSAVQLVIMVSVALVQVLTIRNLFDDRGNSRMSRMMKLAT